MQEVYISIGSNIDPERNIRSAVKVLQERFGELRISPVYRNPAVGFSGDDFYNLVVGFDTEESIALIESVLHEIERNHGRVETQVKFSSRPLDLDLLLYGDLVIYEGARRKLPRAEIERYAFVLGPLADLIPDHQHPLSGQRYGSLWQSFVGEKRLWPVRLRFD